MSITLTTEQALQIEDALANTAEFSAAEQFAREQKAIATIRVARAQEQAEQSQLADASLEPVAWWNGRETVWFEHELYDYSAPDGCTIPLYAAPVRTKDLTDAEIDKAFWDAGGTDLDGCRAVIAADREKNRG